MSNYDQFQTNADAAKTEIIQASGLRVNGHVMINNRPCKISEMTTSKTGKHGGAKVHLTGYDIFTDKKLVCIYSSTDNVEVPIITNTSYQLLNIDEDDYMSLMDEKGGQREDLKVSNDEIGKKIRLEFSNGKTLMINVMSACGEERIMSCTLAKV